MTTLLSIAVINALTVIPLAVLAYFVSRMVRHAAFSHMLWVLVLLKLVTPPLLNLPVTVDVPGAQQLLLTGEVVSGPARSAPLAKFESGMLTQIKTTPIPQINEKPSAASAPSEEMSRANDGPSLEVVPQRRSQQSSMVPGFIDTGIRICTRGLSLIATWWMRNSTVQQLIVGSWLTGSLAWVFCQILCAVRFNRRIANHAIHSEVLQDEVDRLATNIGIIRTPRVLLIDAVVSPMLWTRGTKPLLVFPADLADRLDDESRSTLLMHELSHFKRGDHWVRLLELVATSLFWWHPVVWWARRQIEESEEECCDAWVVSQFPRAPRRYAEALLDTIDYLCESNVSLPPIASGLGQAPLLRRRLTKIMQGATLDGLSARTRCATALLAALLLPLQPFVFGSTDIQKRMAVAIPEGETSAGLRKIQTQPAEIDSSAPMDNLIREESASEAAAVSLPESPLPATSTPRTRAARGEKVWSNAVSSNGRFVLRITTARRVILSDIDSNSEIDLSTNNIAAAAFAPEGDQLVTAGSDGRILAWDARSGTLLRTIHTHPHALRTIAVSPDGELIAAGSRNGVVFTCDAQTGNLPTESRSFAAAVNCVRFSPDGRRIAIAIGDWMSVSRGEVALVESNTLRTGTTLRCATAPGAITFASNDELIVGMWNGRADLWNLVNQQIVGSAVADKSRVAAATFSPDNPVLREMTFIAVDRSTPEQKSTISFLRGLLESSP